MFRSPLTAASVKDEARECGFELAGIAPAAPPADYARYQEWIAAGMAASMTYLADHRAALRSDPRQLLPEAKTVLSLGKLYNVAAPFSSESADPFSGWVSRYAWGEDYHDLLRDRLTRLVHRLVERSPHPFVWRICVDTAPLLERTFARLAGLGWIGRNTCLINQQFGSWLFLGEILLSLDLAADSPAPDRCGTCRRCIEACPTAALVPDSKGGYTLDSRRCISFLTIEKRGPFDPSDQPSLGRHLFGCDICQEVCPWNRRRVTTDETEFVPQILAPPLAELAALSGEEFRRRFRHSPVWRTKYQGFLRNVAAAMGNSGQVEFLEPLTCLARHEDPAVRSAAQHALAALHSKEETALSR